MEKLSNYISHFDELSVTLILYISRMHNLGLMKKSKGELKKDIKEFEEEINDYVKIIFIDYQIMYGILNRKILLNYFQIIFFQKNFIIMNCSVGGNN